MHPRKPEEDNIEIADEEMCIVSTCAIRHPIKVLPSGKFYELNTLLEWLKKSNTDDYLCPLTRTPIISFLYDKEFKKQLDEKYKNHDDLRNEDYIPKSYLEELEKLNKELIAKRFPHVQIPNHRHDDDRNAQSINKMKSVLLGSSYFLLLTILNILKENTETSYFLDALLACTLGSLDYGVRYKTGAGLPSHFFRLFIQGEILLLFDEAEENQENLNRPHYR